MEAAAEAAMGCGSSMAHQAGVCCRSKMGAVEARVAVEVLEATDVAEVKAELASLSSVDPAIEWVGVVATDRMEAESLVEAEEEEEEDEAELTSRGASNLAAATAARLRACATEPRRWSFSLIRRRKAACLARLAGRCLRGSGGWGGRVSTIAKVCGCGTAAARDKGLPRTRVGFMPAAKHCLKRLWLSRCCM